MDKKWIAVIIIVILLVIAIIVAIVLANNQKKAAQAVVANTVPAGPQVGRVNGNVNGTRNINVGQSRRTRVPPATYRQSVGRKA